MSTTMNAGARDLRQHLTQAGGAAEKLIERLSAEAAYASDEKFSELITLIRQLRPLSQSLSGLAPQNRRQ